MSFWKLSLLTRSFHADDAAIISDILEGRREAVSTLPHEPASHVLIHSVILYSFLEFLNTYSMPGLLKGPAGSPWLLSCGALGLVEEPHANHRAVAQPVTNFGKTVREGSYEHVKLEPPWLEKPGKFPPKVVKGMKGSEPSEDGEACSSRGNHIYNQYEMGEWFGTLHCSLFLDRE